MLISADWVLPVEAPPLRDGAVLVSGDRIASVGLLAELAAAHPHEPREHFSGCVMTPGLVNAHTHLTLSALADVVPPQPFEQWLPLLVAALAPWEIADHEASGVVGAEECLASGVTVVGDIAYGAAEVASASVAGLGGVYYWELLGMRADRIDVALEALRYPARADAFGPRVVCGLSPHSPYTSGPPLLRAVHALARAKGVPEAIHLAESQAEIRLLRDGSGPLAATAGRVAFGFSPPDMTPVDYIASLNALDGATVIHLCHTTSADMALLAAHARGAVTCPRSNRYLDNPPPAVTPLLDAGLPVGIGTDSSASNHDLDLMADVRAIRDAEPSLSAATLLEMATLGGARAIGVADRFGTLSADKFADLALFRIAGDQQPEAAMIDHAGRANVEAVMSGGHWRVRAGRLLSEDAAAASRAADARARSIAALAMI